jgi:hypothetical protein
MKLHEDVDLEQVMPNTFSVQNLVDDTPFIDCC